MRIYGPCVALSFLIAVTAHAADTVYISQDAVGAGTVYATLTTDGASGYLASSDIKDYLITVQDPVASYTFTPSNSHFSFALNGSTNVSPFKATSTSLVFDYSSSKNSFFLIQHDPYISFCYQSSGASCISPTQTSLEGFLSSDRNPYTPTGIQESARSGVQVIGQATSSANVAAFQFGSLSNNYMSPSPTLQGASLISSQQSSILIADSTASYIKKSGTPLVQYLLNVDPYELADAVNDVVGVVSSLASLSVDPYLPVVICPTPSCTTLPILPGTGYTVNDPLETASYNLQASLSLEQIKLFSVGQRYIVDDSALGADGYSVFRVDGINGRTISFMVEDVANVPTPAPEPSTWSLLTLGFGVVGWALRRRQKQNVSYA